MSQRLGLKSKELFSLLGLYTQRTTALRGLMNDAAVAQSGLIRQIITIRLFYFMAGIGISVWAIIVPFAKIRFHLDDGTLGLILMASGTGGVLAMPFTGPLIGKFGSRALLLASSVVFCLCLPLLNIAPNILEINPEE